MATAGFNTEDTASGACIVTWVLTTTNNVGAPFSPDRYQDVSVQISLVGTAAKVAIEGALSSVNPVFNVLHAAVAGAAIVSGGAIANNIAPSPANLCIEAIPGVGLNFPVIALLYEHAAQIRPNLYAGGDGTTVITVTLRLATVARG